MARTRRMLSGLQSVCKSTHPSLTSHLFRLEKSQIFHLKYPPPEFQARISNPLVSHVYSSKSSLSPTIFTTNDKSEVSVSRLKMLSYKQNSTNALSSKFNPKTQFSGAVYPFSASPLLGSRSFSSFFGDKGNKIGGTEVSAGTGSTGIGNGDTANAIGNGDTANSIGTEWVDKMKDLSVNTTNYLGQKVKEATDELVPYGQQLLESHPYLEEIIIPVSGTMAATAFAWLILPTILRRFHKYATQGAVTFLPETFLREEIPYEKSFWGALEEPVRYLVTFMSFSQIAIMVAPKALASQYIVEAWRGAVILSLIWFLHRWKTNVFSRALTAKSMAMVDREKLLTLDKVSSVGLFLIGLMALAEACGVAVQSVLTVGGIGGVATAFAAKDILGNVLSGLSMQFSRPFSLGDTIKAGSIEGQVVEMGLTTTSLLNVEKFPVIVPNSLFSSQAIVNKSRAEWRGMVTKIPIQSDVLDKVPQISNDIKTMMKSHPKVFLGKEVPYCFLSRAESYFAELSLGCNLKRMSKEELYSTQEDILLQAINIIKQHGVKLGSTSYDPATQ